jgi:hypothetical protein
MRRWPSTRVSSGLRPRPLQATEQCFNFPAQAVNFNGILDKAATGGNQQLAVGQAQAAEVNRALAQAFRLRRPFGPAWAHRTNGLPVFPGLVPLKMLV